MEISERAKNLGTENAFVVQGEVENLQREGRDIIKFHIGQPDFSPPPNARREGKRAINEGRTGYTSSAGIRELREAVAEYFSKTRGIKVEPGDVVVTNGAKPVIPFTIASVIDYGRGEEVLYPNPGFPIYEAQIVAQGGIPVALPLLEKNGFKFDLDYLTKKINKKTRLLILNSPHNPTGMVLSREELEQIAEIVLRHENFWVLSDEVYCKIIYDREFFSIASVPGMQERVVIMDAASKSYAFAGWRIGFAANKSLAPILAKWMTNFTSCANQPAQWAALEALTGPQAYAEEMVQVFKKRRDLIVKGLNQIRGIRCLMPGGAFYAWSNVTEACKIVGVATSEDFRKKLLHEAGVAVLSDIHFGPRLESEEQYIRFSYAASFKDIKEGLRRIKDYIEGRK